MKNYKCEDYPDKVPPAKIKSKIVGQAPDIYNAIMIPPDIGLAERHAKSRSVKKPIDLEKQVAINKKKYEKELAEWNNLSKELKMIYP